MKKLLFIGLILLAVVSANAQDAAKKSKKELKAEKKAQKLEDINSIIESKTFVFKANNAYPMRGRTINLTSPYEVKVTADSIFSYLPYYGVAYTASYGGTDSPMIFDQPFETCDVEKTKNGNRIKVSVKNGSDRLEFSFHISETGLTSLSVSSINRQAISYSGDIEKIEEKVK